MNHCINCGNNIPDEYTTCKEAGYDPETCKKYEEANKTGIPPTSDIYSLDINYPPAIETEPIDLEPLDLEFINQSYDEV